MRAVMVFVAAHPLCRSFRPCASCDPIFANELKKAGRKSVEVRAVGMALKADGSIRLTYGDLPVSLS
jgi:DNA-binding sugar fermentation-stimulating protein